MAFENFQSTILFIILVFASLTAIFGLTLVHKLFKNRIKMNFNNFTLISFALIAFGYACFAFAEMIYFITYDIFKLTPIVGMADLYWFFGSIFLFVGFSTFSVYLYQKHGQLQKGLFLIIGTGIVFSFLLYYALSTSTMQESKTPLAMFIGYFYPIASCLILIASSSIFLFFEHLDDIEITLLYLLFANIGIFFSDILYTYSFSGSYGFAGSLSDVLSAVAYALCAYAFITLLMKMKNTVEQ